MKGAIIEVLPTRFPENVVPNGAIAFLDRDGVINIGSPNYINAPEELVLLDYAAQSIGKLKRAGYQICIVTNQSAISRGLWDAGQLSKIHNRLQEMILQIDSDANLDLIITCPHRQIDRCSCRKPMPGMLYLGNRILRDKVTLPHGLNTCVEVPDDVSKVNWWKSKPSPVNNLDFIVGDRKSDLGAGWARGIRLFKVDHNVGIAEVIDRLLNTSDEGDIFQPVR
ncbi:MAG: HAD-IIIA family hydrolase [Candidatus Thermoplasmatota archaeon]|nr:HAD-IIIA family hydrolase [Candidatus Thermoplasmatota archaeon]MEC7255569.1 HAD-IIIA family hydrolase [Candidatus Thermoplasmatota archaeon]